MTLTIPSEDRNLVYINAYAPQNSSNEIEKENFYNSLQQTWNKARNRDVKYVIGDLNARLHAQQIGEEEIIGTHVFGRGQNFLNNRNEGK